MESNSELLKLNSRKEIYSLILNNPGLHLRELSRRSNVAYGTLRYHLKFLLKNNLIRKEQSGGKTRYYIVNGTSNQDKILFEVFRDKTLRTITIALFTANNYIDLKEYYGSTERFGTHTINDIPKIIKTRWCKPFNQTYKLGIHRKTLEYHINKLIKLGIVDYFYEGREKKYFLEDPLKIVLFMIRNQSEMSYDAVDNMVKFIKDGKHEVFHRIIEELYSVFPNPYHI